MSGHLDLIQTGLTVFAALLYIFIGHRTGQRRVATEARGAQRAWQFWWYGLAAFTLLGVVVAPWVRSRESVPLMLAYMVPLVVVLTGAVASLLYYLLYLYTGRRAVRHWAVAYFLLVSVFLSLLVSGALSPEDYPRFERDAEGDVAFQSGPSDGTYGTLVFVALMLLVVPLTAGALAYVMLLFRLEGRTERYRIAMVGGGLLFWFGSTFLSRVVGRALPAGLPDWWPVASRVISVLAAFLVVLAYYPPRPLQRRFGLRSLERET